MNEEESLIPAAKAPESDELIEITTHIRPDQLLGLEIIQTTEQQKRGSPVEMGEVIRQAIDMFINSRIVAVRLRRNIRPLELNNGDGD